MRVGAPQPSSSRTTSGSSNTRPVVLVTTDSKDIGGHPSFAVGRKYVTPIVELMAAQPLLLPPLGRPELFADLLELADGLLLTGSPSNIEPHHYGQSQDDAQSPADAARDATTLPLLRAALQDKVPVMAICRGFQEVNVALGGTLHQAVHQVADKDDHREDKHASLEVQYGPAHRVDAVPGGRLQRLLGMDSWLVNSVHGQGVDRLADALQAEAIAGDGLVEAFTLRDDSIFLLGVQWHPEWQAADNPVSVKLFDAFAAACRRRAALRRRSGTSDPLG